MKKLSYLFLFLAGVIFTVVSCSDDDEGPAGNPTPPTLTVTPGSTGASPGDDVTFTVTATPGTGASAVSVTANGAAVSGGTYVESVPADAEIGSTITVSFIATDDNNPPHSTSFEATITVGKPVVDLTEPNISDGDLGGNTVYNMTADVEYLLDGLVFLDEGSELNIEPGTVVRFKALPTTDNASALIITRGSQIFADGTIDDPIIFTAEADDLTGNTLTPEDNGQWGGLLILGRATAEKGGAGEIQIEGIDSSEPRGLYGEV